MRPLILSMMLGLTVMTGSSRSQAVEASTIPKMWVFVGTYTDRQSKGIYYLEFDPSTGALTPKGIAAAVPSPSFLAVHPSQKFLYAANEVHNFQGKNHGSVTAYSLDPKTGALIMLGRMTSGGADPCYLTVDPTGKNLLVANYSGGSLEVLPIDAEGKLGEPSSFVQHQGSSLNKSRQSTPHAHSIDLDASGKLAVAADLGLDKLMVYRLDPVKGTIVPNETPFASLAPGSGPRHFAFHPDGKHGYVINEMASTVTALDFDPKAGTFAELQTLSTRAPGGKPGNSTAEIQIHPTGKFVYGSNRGDDTIAIYAVDASTGKLTLSGIQPTLGKTPRNFGIDPTGRFLIVANQNADNLVVFRVDQTTGLLTQVGEPVSVPMPVCVKFVPAA